MVLSDGVLHVVLGCMVMRCDVMLHVVLVCGVMRCDVVSPGV